MARTTKKLRTLMDEYDRVREEVNRIAVTLADGVHEERKNLISAAEEQALGLTPKGVIDVFPVHERLSQYQGTRWALRQVARQLIAAVSGADVAWDDSLLDTTMSAEDIVAYVRTHREAA